MKRSVGFALLSLSLAGYAQNGHMVPVGHYLANAKQGAIELPSTKLNHFYFPAKIDSISLNSTWSKSVTTSSSYSKTGGSGGSGLSVFALNISNSTDHTIYANLRGVNNQSWQMACTIPASSTSVNYESTCVSTGDVQKPIGFPYVLYLSRTSFSSQATYAAGQNAYSCTLITGQASLTKDHAVSLAQPIAYSASIADDHCVIATT